MDKPDATALAALGRWIREFRAEARQLDSHRVAGQWWKLRLTPSEAAAWANLGYLPGEAAPLIAQGVTPAMARDLDDLADEIAGSPEERAAQVIDRLVADGVLVDPVRVRQVQDPDDPDHVIVHIE